jgi:integrase
MAAVKRTLGKALSFGVSRGYFGEEEPFHCSSLARAEVVRAEKKRAADREAEEHAAAEVTLDDHAWAPGLADPAALAAEHNNRAERLAAEVVEAKRLKRYAAKVCPTAADVEAFAAAFEEQYPGYGARLVLLAYATGLRINELLALRVGDIDLATGQVHVRRQLDRDRAWPATKLPKGHKTRTALLWSCYTWAAEDLIADAARPGRADPGWLFPRHRSIKAFARQVGNFATTAAAAADWPWSFHWLRHAYAALGLAPVEFGGFGLPLASVSAWLGHKKESTTQDMYDVRQSGDIETARRVTTHYPGMASSQRRSTVHGARSTTMAPPGGPAASVVSSRR